MSTALVYTLSGFIFLGSNPFSSGAAYAIVPILVRRKVPSSSFETPKSASLTQMGFNEATKTFCNMELGLAPAATDYIEEMGVKQDLWFNVTMANTFLVHNCKALEKLSGNFFRFQSYVWVFDILGQITVHKVLHDQEDKIPGNVLVPPVKLNEEPVMLCTSISA